MSAGNYRIMSTTEQNPVGTKILEQMCLCYTTKAVFFQNVEHKHEIS